MFDPNDLYSVSAGVTLFNYWNPIVTKFDSSAFYNWETDNLPLHDVEERSYYLWEKATGWATSSLPGLALCVSSSIPTASDASANVFTTVQDAIDALPQVLRQPTLIEVALSGDLGDIHLHNIRCEGNGSLEIINRVFTPFDPSSASWQTADADTDEIYSLRSSEASAHIAGTSALSFSANTSNLWWPAGYVAVAQMTNPRATRNLRSQRVSVTTAEGFATDNDSNAWIGVNDFMVPDINSTGSRVTDTTADVSAINGADARMSRGIYPATPSVGANGFATNNSFTSVKITSCNGPIWLRRFAVVAGDTKGIQILNTEGITLEDMLVTRAGERGLDIINSEVTLRRRFIATRNYDTASRADTETAGIHAVGSKLHFMGDSVLSGNAVMFTAAHSTVGMDLRNCEVTSENAGELHVHNCERGIRVTGSHVSFDGMLDVFECHTGIQALGSELELWELVAQYCSVAGVKGINSTFTYGEPDVNPTASLASVGDGTLISKNYRYLLHANGQHLVLENCVWEPVSKDDNVTKTAATLVADHFAHDGSAILPALDLTNTKAVFGHTRVATGEPTAIGIADGEGEPGFTTAGYLVHADGGFVNFIGTSSIASILTGFVNATDGGAAVAAIGGHIKFQGPTFIGAAGVDCLADQGGHIEFKYNDKYSWNLDSSTCHTGVVLHGYRANLVATNGSTIKMEDLGFVPLAWGAAGGDASDIDLRYSVECSSLKVGGGMSLLCSNEEVPIRPEQFPAYYDKYNYTLDPGSNFKFTNSFLNGSPYLHYVADVENMDVVNFRANISNGGTTVRAHNDSVVKVSNVQFFQGPVNADGVYYDCSIPGGCNDLRIWAITGNSVLDAAHMATSGTWPSQAGYTGPRAAYLSGVEPFAPSSVAYGAFLGIPYNGEASALSAISDTSTLSILDFYGSGVETSANTLSGAQTLWSTRRYGDTIHYGETGYANQGPFRIYFDVDPAAMTLLYTSAGTFVHPEDTRPYQTMAQGYPLSGSCSALGGLADAYYPKLLNWDTWNVFDSSGYYLTKDFVDPGKQTVRLDESAAEMFANAKNASIEQLGRPPLVDIYRSNDNNYGLYQTVTTDLAGKGFKGTTDFDIRRI